MAPTNRWWSVRADLFFGLIVAVLCLGLQNSSSIFSHIVAEPISFNRVVTGWGSRTEADIRSLQVASYYISVGRPRGACEILVDGKQIDSNISEIPELRNGLLLGGAFVQSVNSPLKKIVINCNGQRGFGENFSQPPIVAPLYSGIILQFWRAVTELLIGPLSSLLIVLSFIFRANSKKESQLDSANDQTQSPFEGWRYLTFGLAAFIHAISLAYYTRFFFQGIPASIFMVVARNLLNLMAMLLFTSITKKYKLLVLGHGVLLFCAIAVGFWWPNELKEFYQWEYAYLPISSAIITVSLFTAEPRSKAVLFLRRILFGWTLIQTVDLSTNLFWTDAGVYAGPSVVLFLGLSAFYIRYLERIKTMGIESAAARALTAINSEIPVETVLKDLSAITRAETKYSRVSAYVDGFCIGKCDSPNRSYFRIAEAGYTKETKLDSIINFSEGRGPIMAEANRMKSPILRVGSQDKAWFLVVPIGMHAFINLSNDRPKSNFIAYESLEIIMRIFQSLLSLERRLIDLGLHQSAALQRLRSRRGDGTWDEEFGAIFIDINDYSHLADNYGNAYTKFISDRYIPALIKAVTKYAVSEHMAGDEVYLIVLTDLLSENCSLRTAVVETISEIDKFVNDQGANLSRNAGFSQMSVSIGVSIGFGTVVCDSLSVRTSGQLVNHAKRLQEEAGRGGLLVSASSGLDFDGTNYKLGDQVLIQKKKQVVLAQKVLRLGDPSDNSEKAS